MQAFESARTWRVVDGPFRRVSDRAPAASVRFRRKAQAIAGGGRSYALFVTVAGVAARMALALAPWSGLAWMFIAK